LLQKLTGAVGFVAKNITNSIYMIVNSEIFILYLLGPVNTNPIGSVASEKAPIKARGVKFGHSK
jgi:hypothetical protein